MGASPFAPLEALVMRSGTGFGIAALLLLVVGYLAGTARLEPGLRPASAGPTPLEASSGSFLTARPDGTALMVWTLKDGVAVEAREYTLNADRVADAQGLRIMNKRILVTTYVGPAQELGK